MSDVPAGVRTSGDTPTGTRLVLLRHGEAVCNVAGVIGGPRGCTGLTDRGREQARQLGMRLATSGECADVTVALSSSLTRARETLALVAVPLQLRQLVDVPALGELDPGVADALTWSEYIETIGAADFDVEPSKPFAPGGESWLGFYHRCVAAFAALETAYPGQRLLVVTHGGVIEQAVKFATGSPAAARLRLLTEHCSISEIELVDGRARLLRYNDAGRSGNARDSISAT